MNKGLALLILLFAFCFSAYGEEKKCPPIVKRLVLSGKRGAAATDISEKDFISILDVYVPDQESLIEELSPYLNQTIDDETLGEIKQKIVNHYQKNNRPLIIVEIPPQEITCGTVQFWVLEGTIGSVQFTGNRWYPKTLIAKRVPLKEGDIFDEAEVLDNLAWLNQNPFHQTEIILTPGQGPYTTDAEFKTYDRFPLRLYAGTDNTGTQNTGPNRWYLGVNLSVPALVDNLLIYQFTAAYSLHQFQAHYGNLILFFPCKQGLSFFGGFAKIHPTIPGFTQEGKSWQVSGRHTIPILPLFRPFGQKIEWGVDFKNTNNNLFFTSATEVAPVSSSSVNLFQLALNYELECSWEEHELFFLWENYLSPARWLPNQTVADYGNLRPGARPFYYYSKATLSDLYRMPMDFTLMMEFRGQVSTISLLPSEQFGLGGLYTVRGYEEREFNGDNAILGNFELATPPFHGFKFVTFLDAGWGYNYHTSSGEIKSQYLASAGPGARWQMKPYFNARIDYGFKWHSTPLGNHHLGRLHFSVMASY